jgi:hypothetical protein
MESERPLGHGYPVPGERRRRGLGTEGNSHKTRKDDKLRARIYQLKDDGEELGHRLRRKEKAAGYTTKTTYRMREMNAGSSRRSCGA